jgi:hypothetical protein
VINHDEKNYQDFFKEELYGGFVNYLIDKYGAKSVISTLRDDQLITKKGVNFLFRRQFNEFLSLNPEIAKEFARNHGRCMSLRNICGGSLAFPIDTQDDILMVRENIRVPEAIPVQNDIPRAGKEIKGVAARMRGQTIKGDSNEKKYRVSKRLTIHFKEGYATKIGKTTESFMVDSRSEAMDILLVRYEKRVAYAIIQNEEEFCFVKPRNGKRKRNRKLRGKV